MMHFRDNVTKEHLIGNHMAYTIYQMEPLSMTLSDLWPRFQGHDIFEVEYRKNSVA